MTRRRAPLPARPLIIGALVALVAASTLGPSLAVAAPQPEAKPKPGDVIPGQLLVRFDPTSSTADKGKARALVAGRKVRESALVKGLEVVSMDLDTESALRKLRGANGVLYAEPDRYIAIDAVPNDPEVPLMWGMVSGVGVNAPDAWDVTTGEGAVVAVVDSGVTLDHPDLAANIWANPAETPNGIDDDDNGYVDDIHGWDFTDGDADPTDEHGHGTHVAGTIGAVGDNGIGVAGVAYSSTLMPVRVIGAKDTDAAGAAHVVYSEYFSSDNTPLPNPGVFYATNATGTWTRTRIGNPGEAGPVVIDAAGHAHVAFTGYDDGPGGTAYFGVRYATNATGTWVSQRILTGNFREPAIALDATGKIHIAATLASNTEMHIVYASNATGSWTSRALTSGSFDSQPSIAIRPNGQPSVAYARQGFGARLAERSGTTWTNRNVLLDPTIYLARLIVDADGERRVLLSTSSVAYDVCDVPLCPDYPGLRYAIGGDTGAFTIVRLTFNGEDFGTDLERAPDGSLRALVERNAVGLSDMTIEGPTPD